MKLGHTKVKHLLALDVVVCHQTLNLFVIYKKLNPTKKIKFTSCLLKVAKGWIENQYNVCSEISTCPSKRASCKDAPGDIKMLQTLHKWRQKERNRLQVLTLSNSFMCRKMS